MSLHWIMSGLAVVLVMGTVIIVGMFAVTWYGETSYAATRRWRAINRAQPKTCKCGAPGTVWRTSPWGYVGREAPGWWYCAAHADVPIDVPWGGGKPLIDQAREECAWRHVGGDGVTTKCGCGTHVGGADWDWD